jgi:hypothetical protein
VLPETFATGQHEHCGHGRPPPGAGFLVSWREISMQRPWRRGQQTRRQAAE